MIFGISTRSRSKGGARASFGSVSSVIKQSLERIHQSLSFAGSPDGFIGRSCCAARHKGSPSKKESNNDEKTENVGRSP